MVALDPQIISLVVMTMARRVHLDQGVMVHGLIRMEAPVEMADHHPIEQQLEVDFWLMVLIMDKVLVMVQEEMHLLMGRKAEKIYMIYKVAESMGALVAEALAW